MKPKIRLGLGIVGLIVLAIIIISSITSTTPTLSQENMAVIEFGDVIDYVTYTGTTDKSFKVSWDAQTAADYYVVWLNNMEREERIELGRPTTNEFEFQVPRSGHWVAEIQACQTVTDGDDTCSESSLSSNSEVAIVNGENKAWWIYGYLAKPGDINLGTRIMRTLGFGGE